MHTTQDEDKIKTNKAQNIAQKTKTTMSNSEKLATLGTQDKGRIQTTQKTKTHQISMGKHFLPLLEYKYTNTENDSLTVI